MNENVLKSSGLVMVNSQNYNRWQMDIFKPHLGRKTLEIGCGLGNISQFLMEEVEELVSVDVKPEAVNYCNKRFANRKGFKAQLLDIFDPQLKELPFGDFDSIVFCNVLEHIEDDLGAMRRCHNLLKKDPSSKLILLVPAHSFLYGTCDREAGHHRRYSRNMILNLAEEAQFKVQDLFAFNFIGAIGWYVNYVLLKREATNNEEGSLQVDFFDKYLANIGKFIESKVRPPFGISYIAMMGPK